MSEQGRRVYHLALREHYAQMGARFETFGDWSVPAAFGPVEREYRSIRESTALFDRSHRSRFIVSGTDALEVLEASFAGGIRELDEGRALRAVALDDRGVIRDVAVIARTGGISYLVVGEPGQRSETLARFHDVTPPGYDVRVEDRTESTCLLGIVGPGSARLVQEQLTEGLPSRLPAMNVAMFEFHGFRSLAVRTSDTGEDGFELMLAPAVMQHLVESLAGGVATMVGSVAQETCRVEACIPAYAPDLEPGLTPAQADIDVLLGVEGGEAGRVLSALLVEGDPMAPGVPVIAGSEEAGEIRSCVHSPMLDATIALAIVNERYAMPGNRLLAGGAPATVVAKPFLRRRQQA